MPIWFEWDGAEARIFTSRTSAKVKRLQADPRAALSVEEGVGVPERWVTVEGTVTVDEAGGWALAQKLAARYYTPERCAEALASWEKMKDQWVVLRITPARILG